MLNYFFKKNNSQNKIEAFGTINVHPTSRIVNSTIIISKDSKVIIEENVIISGYNIYVKNGEIRIGANSRLEQGNNALKPTISLDSGNLNIADHCIIRSDICIRFNGQCSIGKYTGIMENTEIRVDEHLSIGDFNMISYECMIYDTNTHFNYSIKTRRSMTIKDFPNIGTEPQKPETKPVNIGSDCWLGKRAVVLKGVQIGNNSTVAACAVVTKNVPENSLVYGNPSISKLKNFDLK